MKKTLQHIASVMMIVTLLIGTPMSTTHAQSSVLPFDLDGFFDGLGMGGGSDSSSSSSVTCEITANNTEIFVGGSVTLSWNTPNADTITINGQSVSGSTGSIEMTDIRANTTYTVSASGGGSSCTASVRIICIPVPVDCRLEIIKTVDKTTANVGDTLTYGITVKNIGTTDCTGSGVKIEDILSDKLTYLSNTSSANITPGYDGGIPVYTTGDRTVHFNGDILTPGEQGTATIQVRVNTPTSCGDFTIPNQARVTAYELSNFGTWINSNTVNTAINNDCPDTQDPAPTCDSFTANPSTIVLGTSATLAWQTSNATRVSIDNGIGDVVADGSRVVSPVTSTTYNLTVFGTQNRSVNCSVPVTVSADPVPVCELFTATPNSLPSTGGQVSLNWRVTGATNVSISPTIGTVGAIGTQNTNVTTNTNFVLTATDADGDQVTCAAPVTLGSAPVFSCPNNVSFTASDTSIRRGDQSTLSWSTNNVDSVSISGINATALSGSTTVEPSSDTTYVLTATKAGQSINCPVTISVESGGGGGGGGGSSSPRCELTVSDNKIKSGEQVTLKWDTSRATKVILKDDNSKTLMSTEKYDKDDREDYYDGTLKVRPTRDTEYTLTASRGSKDRTCKVKVNVDDLKVLTDRDQQPLVAGISLSNVPYTGFEAGTLLTTLFYALLAAWACFVSYLVVQRRKLAGDAIVTESRSVTSYGETIRPDVFVASVVAPEVATTTPQNLPTGIPVVGYENLPASWSAQHATDEIVTALENRAHEQMALLSSDALRHFIATTEGSVERNEVLDQVIADAKNMFPLEDGWVVINEIRMRDLCKSCAVTPASTSPATIPEGSGSLAEAIVTGNVVAAYEMIGNRPMFSLADAAADFDSIIRARRGEAVVISTLLTTHTAKLSDEKLKNIIAALTGALDGTYTDEASAVKMAIMKAVKEVA